MGVVLDNESWLVVVWDWLPSVHAWPIVCALIITSSDRLCTDHSPISFSLYLLHVLTAFSYMWYIRMVAYEPSVAKMFICKSDASSSCFIVFCLRSAFSTRKLYVCTVGCRNCMRVRQKDVRSNVPSLVKLLQCLRKRILLDEITLVVTQWFNNTILLPGTIK